MKACGLCAKGRGGPAFHRFGGYADQALSKEAAMSIIHHPIVSQSRTACYL